jgi:hypothetical protein
VLTIATTPDYVLRMTSTGDWQLGTSLSGPWTPIPADVPVFVRVTSDPTNLYVQGAGTLSPMVSSTSGGTGAITAPAILNGGTTTSDQAPLTIFQTRNNGATVFDTLLLELTDTAVDPASTALKMTVNGSPIFVMYDSGTLAVSGLISGGAGVDSGLDFYMDNFPGHVRWSDINFNNPTLGTTDGNSIDFIGTDPSGSPVPIWTVGIANATPTFHFTVPVLAATITVSTELVFEDQDGRDPNWEAYANSGNWYLKSDDSGNTVLVIQPSGAVGLVGNLTITEAVPSLILAASGGGKTWTVQADGSDNLSFIDTSDSTTALVLSPTQITFGLPVVGLVEQIPGLIEAPIAKTYIVLLETAIALTINQLSIATVSGSCTVDVQINGTGVTGLTGISVTSTPQTVSATALNTMAIGDKLTLVVSSPSTPADLAFVLQTTR